MKIPYLKMSGAGNDFVIFDARKKPIILTNEQIKKICDRKIIGCDQLIILKSSTAANCLMEIFNSDGSKASACGNATRCVASILMNETKHREVKIKTAAGILKCWKSDNLISVDMGIPTFDWKKIPLSHQTASDKISLHGFDFTCANIGNPHAVTFIDRPLNDEIFFNVGPKVENDKIFPQKTNVEFAQIISEDKINVRVWERGSGETLACGSGACAVGVLAIKNKLVAKNKITTQFKGGDLIIEWNGDGSAVIMTGDFKKTGDGTIDETF
ncbi:MAG: diaminopimelate epimerase [Rickettsiales bacterium]|nr:diaminopimelate epimerase [Rickettsiales bacterium]